MFHSHKILIALICKLQVKYMYVIGAILLVKITFGWLYMKY